MSSASICSHVLQPLKILSQLPPQIVLYLHCREIRRDRRDSFRWNRPDLRAGKDVMLREDAT
jgi:hypothetical protein